MAPLLGNWFFFALASLFSFAGMVLVLKKLTYAISSPVLLFYLLGVTSLLFFIWGKTQSLSFEISKGSCGLLLIAAAFAFAGNFTDMEAVRLAPNPGYASAVKAGQIVIISLAALALFPDQRHSLGGACGILLILIGISLLALQR